MKKFFSLLVILSIFLFPKTSFALTDYLNNLGDFEGDPSGWDFTNFFNNTECGDLGTGCLTITTSTYDTYHGSQALKFSPTSSAYSNNLFMEKIIAVDPNVDYNLTQSIYAKAYWQSQDRELDFQVVQAMSSSTCPANFGDNSIAWNFSTSSPGWTNCSNGCFSAPTMHATNINNTYQEFSHSFFTPSTTGTQYLCMRAMATVNFDTNDIWLDYWRVLGNGEGTNTTTPPTTTPVTSSTEDNKITNIILLVLVAVGIIDLIRRLFLPMQNR